jgi:hypothetical protein
MYKNKLNIETNKQTKTKKPQKTLRKTEKYDRKKFKK